MRFPRCSLFGFCAILALPAASFAEDAPVADKAVGALRDQAKSATDVQALANKIDAMIAAKLEAEKITPAPIAEDPEFLRRVYLDLVGRVPMAAEARAFLDDPAPDKRKKLVEKLLASPGYSAHFTNMYKHLLLPEADADFQIQFFSADFEPWLRKQFADNVSYDKIVREIVTVSLNPNGQANVNPFQIRETPTPFAFYVAKQLKPENLAAATARTFLGIRLECAQCHDHPFAKWKRDQFWGYAAFFGGVQRTGDDENPGVIREVADRRELSIPNTEKVVQATFLDGSEPEWTRAGSRETLADWMTSKNNKYLARAAVNRLWSQFFGVGIVDPVDDLGDENVPSHPELIDELAKEFAAHGFDLKFVTRAITSSRTYNAASTGGSPSHDDPRLFARMALRGMSPEQLFDSIATVTGYKEAPSNQNVFIDNLTSNRAKFMDKFKLEDDKPIERQTSILQALTLMNGKIVEDATSLKKGRTLAAIAEAPFMDTTEKVEALYVAALSRRPTAEESAKMVDYVTKGGPAGDSKKALADVFWTLLNSAEFLLNH
jgi:Protein of unknown function (DUF1553)/Protein of unknown function (DUF1549)